jgi:hypothetical protein
MPYGYWLAEPSILAYVMKKTLVLSRFFDIDYGLETFGIGEICFTDKPRPINIAAGRTLQLRKK